MSTVRVAVNALRTRRGLPPEQANAASGRELFRAFDILTQNKDIRDSKLTNQLRK